MFQTSEPQLIYRVVKYLSIGDIVTLSRTSKQYLDLKGYLQESWYIFLAKKKADEYYPEQNINRLRIAELTHAFSYNWAPIVGQVWSEIKSIVHTDKYFVSREVYRATLACIGNDNPEAFLFLHSYIGPRLHNVCYHTGYFNIDNPRYVKYALIHSSYRILKLLNYKNKKFFNWFISDIENAFNIHWIIDLFQCNIDLFTDSEQEALLLAVKANMSPHNISVKNKLYRYFRYHAPAKYRHWANLWVHSSPPGST